MSGLKACPFCGSEDVFYDANISYIECKSCGFTFDTLFRDWNNRPIEDALLARAERAEAMVERLIEAGQAMRFHLYTYDDVDPTIGQWSDLLFWLKNE